MKFYWYNKIINFFGKKKHMFVIKSSETELQSIKDVLNEDIINTDVSVYSNCKQLLYDLNQHKNYYDVGIVSKNDKKNTANILVNIINTINPKIRVVTYNDKKTFKNQLSML
jgi:hypothetical protein